MSVIEVLLAAFVGFAVGYHLSSWALASSVRLGFLFGSILARRKYGCT